MTRIDLNKAADFPILSNPIHGKRLVYLDSAASAQKPRVVLEAMTRFYETDYANIHRGVHELSQRATTRYEEGRATVWRFIGAAYDDEIVFTRGATEAINLVAASWGRAHLREGDEVVLTQLEHHANIVPWQMLRDQIGIKLRIVPAQADASVLLDAFRAALGPRTKLAAFAHVSNAFGTVLPVEEMVQEAHKVGALALVDGCQAVCHKPVDVQKLDADFYVFSGHKLYGPTGIGALYGKREILKTMTPYQTGGDMIASVTFEETFFQDPPARFEAGTPAIAEVVGLAAALDYLSVIGMETIEAHEARLLEYAVEKLSNMKGVTLVGGTTLRRAGIVSFTIDGVHPHDTGTILDREGVAIRAGNHCAQPAHEALGLVATARASFGLYSTHDDVDALVNAIGKAQEIFG